MRKTIVIGGGAAGMLASYFAKSIGDSVTLIEKNEKLGKKIYITGKGRCNVTNDCSVDEFMQNVVSNPKFLSSSLWEFAPEDLMALLEKYGLSLKVERGNRVFPTSDKSNDVIKCLTYMMQDVGVCVKLNERVQNIVCEDGKVSKVITDCGEYVCDKIILATGGKSYPLTGSTGDGYNFAKKLGHTIVDTVPSLVGFKLANSFCQNVAGLTLKNVQLTYFKGKKAVSQFGEMLFTHTGISGPIVLTLSAQINRCIQKNEKLYLDLKPSLSYEQLDNRVLRDFEEKINCKFKNSLDGLLPKSFIEPFIEACKISPDKPNNIITKEERKRIVDCLKAFELTFVSLAPLEEAVVTAGGISVKEINPKTMESKLISGLYFAGEVIDVDAFTGGFNLQIAFSTGRKAGLS